MTKITTFEIDAAGRVAGRIATEIAMILRGKNTAQFAPNALSENRVRVINAGKMKFTGHKLEQNAYKTHSGHPGGFKETPLKKVFAENSPEVLRHAVWNMLPKNKLREEMMKHLTIVA